MYPNLSRETLATVGVRAISHNLDVRNRAFNAVRDGHMSNKIKQITDNAEITKRDWYAPELRMMSVADITRGGLATNVDSCDPGNGGECV